MVEHAGEASIPGTASEGRAHRTAPPLWKVFTPIVVLLVMAAVLDVLGIYHLPPLRAHYLGAAGACAALAGMVGMFELYRQSRGRQIASRGLHDAELRVSDVIETAMDSIVTIDERQRIVGFNRAAELCFGRTRAEVLGNALDVLIPAHSRAMHRDHVDRFAQTGASA
ncbi:MAG: PAS domain-containing protein, partial [Casimicrobiaceae bacterium]